MSYSPGSLFRISFTLSHPVTLALSDADIAPTGQLWRNGSDSGEPVTVAAVSGDSTGEYVASGTIPSEWSNGDRIELRLAAEVSAVPGVRWVQLGNLDARVADVPATVWSNGTRTLTSYGALVSQVAAALLGRALTVLSLVAADGSIRLRQGDTATIRYPVTAWDSLAGATVTFKFVPLNPSGATLTFTGSADDVGEATQYLVLALTSTQAATLATGRDVYKLYMVATWTTPAKATATALVSVEEAA